MKERVVTVQIVVESDATPIAKAVQTASEFESQIYINCESKHINAKSIMGMMSLSLTMGEKISIVTDGPDEEAALEAMIKCLSKN